MEQDQTPLQDVPHADVGGQTLSKLRAKGAETRHLVPCGYELAMDFHKHQQSAHSLTLRGLFEQPFGSYMCEGGGDVVGVVTPLVGGVAQAFHDDRVVELRVQLGVQEVEGKDREEQVEVERERRAKEVRPWI